MIRLLARLLGIGLFCKDLEEPIIFTRCRLIGIIQTGVLPNRKQLQQAVVVLPARILQITTACRGNVLKKIGTSVHFPGAIKM